ncbi:hypothetical protein WA158_008205 [Blastocystis sp. Blastoise]
MDVSKNKSESNKKVSFQFSDGKLLIFDELLLNKYEECLLYKIYSDPKSIKNEKDAYIVSQPSYIIDNVLLWLSNSLKEEKEQNLDVLNQYLMTLIIYFPTSYKDIKENIKKQLLFSLDRFLRSKFTKIYNLSIKERINTNDKDPLILIDSIYNVNANDLFSLSFECLFTKDIIQLFEYYSSILSSIQFIHIFNKVRLTYKESISLLFPESLFTIFPFLTEYTIQDNHTRENNYNNTFSNHYIDSILINRINIKTKLFSYLQNNTIDQSIHSFSMNLNGNSLVQPLSFFKNKQYKYIDTLILNESLLYSSCPFYLLKSYLLHESNKYIQHIILDYKGNIEGPLLPLPQLFTLINNKNYPQLISIYFKILVDNKDPLRFLYTWLHQSHLSSLQTIHIGRISSTIGCSCLLDYLCSTSIYLIIDDLFSIEPHPVRDIFPSLFLLAERNQLLIQDTFYCSKNYDIETLKKFLNTTACQQIHILHFEGSIQHIQTTFSIWNTKGFPLINSLDISQEQTNDLILCLNSLKISIYQQLSTFLLDNIYLSSTLITTLVDLIQKHAFQYIQEFNLFSCSFNISSLPLLLSSINKNTMPSLTSLFIENNTIHRESSSKMILFNDIHIPFSNTFSILTFSHLYLNSSIIKNLCDCFKHYKFTNCNILQFHYCKYNSSFYTQFSTCIQNKLFLKIKKISIKCTMNINKHCKELILFLSSINKENMPSLISLDIQYGVLSLIKHDYSDIYLCISHITEELKQLNNSLLQKEDIELSNNNNNNKTISIQEKQIISTSKS